MQRREAFLLRGICPSIAAAQNGHRAWLPGAGLRRVAVRDGVLVADQDAVKPGQVGDAKGDRFALVVAGPGAEPGIGQEGSPADLDQMAAVRDAGDRGLVHGRAPVLWVGRLVVGQRAKAEKSVSALSQIAWMTWSGVSCCGECPVWDDRRGVVWFVDVLAPAVFSLDPKPTQKRS